VVDTHENVKRVDVLVKRDLFNFLIGRVTYFVLQHLVRPFVLAIPNYEDFCERSKYHSLFVELVVLSVSLEPSLRK
jgi:hypothetical protein